MPPTRARRSIVVASAALGACAVGVQPAPAQPFPVQPVPVQPGDASGQPIAPRASVPRGRDPWVFSCIFEDRAGTIVVAFGQGLFGAFNTATGSWSLLWHGDIELRGKVYDFSQDNSRATGTRLLEAPRIALSLPDPSAGSSPESGWRFSNVKPGPGAWVFATDPARDGSGEASAITSPAFDATPWSSLYVAFDELSRRGPARVEVSTDDGESWNAQWFHSCTHSSKDDEWQWNFKRIEPRSKAMRIRFVQEQASFAKQLRAIRVFGDQPAWEGASNTRTAFRGYHVGPAGSGVTLVLDVFSGAALPVRVERTPDLDPGSTPQQPRFAERFRVSGLRPGQSLTLALPAQAGTTKVVYAATGARLESRVMSPIDPLGRAASDRADQHTLTFVNNGEATLVAALLAAIPEQAPIPKQAPGPAQTGGTR
ncbi:MAG: hypothetical protein SFZ23_04800 [Planctomycetota bacterium]|nr:hypothetical protein [Planctomycetota bacterium]